MADLMPSSDESGDSSAEEYVEKVLAKASQNFKPTWSHVAPFSSMDIASKPKEFVIEALETNGGNKAISAVEHLMSLGVDRRLICINASADITKERQEIYTQKKDEPKEKKTISAIDHLRRLGVDMKYLIKPTSFVEKDAILLPAQDKSKIRETEISAKNMSKHSITAMSKNDPEITSVQCKSNGHNNTKIPTNSIYIKKPVPSGVFEISQLETQEIQDTSSVEREGEKRQNTANSRELVNQDLHQILQPTYISPFSDRGKAIVATNSLLNADSGMQKNKNILPAKLCKNSIVNSEDSDGWMSDAVTLDSSIGDKYFQDVCARASSGNRTTNFNLSSYKLNSQSNKTRISIQTGKKVQTCAFTLKLLSKSLNQLYAATKTI